MALKGCVVSFPTPRHLHVSGKQGPEDGTAVAQRLFSMLRVLSSGVSKEERPQEAFLQLFQATALVCDHITAAVHLGVPYQTL